MILRLSVMPCLWGLTNPLITLVFFKVWRDLVVGLSIGIP